MYLTLSTKLVSPPLVEASIRIGFSFACGAYAVVPGASLSATPAAGDSPRSWPQIKRIKSRILSVSFAVTDSRLSKSVCVFHHTNESGSTMKRRTMKSIVEPGWFDIMMGTSSVKYETVKFEVAAK